MGGYVAFELVRRHPGIMRVLVLADTRPGSDADEARENRLRMAQTARSGGTGPLATATIAIPNATCFEIPEAGHLSNLENPGPFNRRVREFLEAL